MFPSDDEEGVGDHKFTVFQDSPVFFILPLLKVCEIGICWHAREH